MTRPMNSISFAYLSAVRLGVLVAVILAIRSTIYPTVAFGWGSYGHQQINVAAAVDHAHTAEIYQSGKVSG